MLRILKQYYPVRNALFVVGEGVFILASVFLACWILIGKVAVETGTLIILKSMLITLVCQACLYYNDLYDLNITDSFWELCIRLFQALGASAIILAFIYLLFPSCIIGRGIFIVSIAFVIVLIVSWRIAYTQVLKRGLFNQKIIILGSGALAGNIIKEIQRKKDCGYHISATVSENNENTNEHKELEYICKQGYKTLCSNAKQLGIKKIVVAIEEKRKGFPVKELLECRVEGIEVLEGVSFYELLTGKLDVEQINPGWLIFSQGFQKSKTRHFFKRIIDITLSLGMLVVFFPVLVIVTLLIKIESPGPVFFSQERVGEKRRAYKVHK
ncbi:MAG: capsular biosynthesis protein CpsE, partial [Desulfobacteraceae bacterium]|nr:capsular biosynthesis protein CpsE [Desulfobacteraceae bacterium]